MGLSLCVWFGHWVVCTCVIRIGHSGCVRVVHQSVISETCHPGSNILVNHCDQRSETIWTGYGLSSVVLDLNRVMGIGLVYLRRVREYVRSIQNGSLGSKLYWVLVAVGKMPLDRMTYTSLFDLLTTIKDLLYLLCFC